MLHSILSPMDLGLSQVQLEEKMLCPALQLLINLKT